MFPAFFFDYSILLSFCCYLLLVFSAEAGAAAPSRQEGRSEKDSKATHAHPTLDLGHPR